MQHHMMCMKPHSTHLVSWYFITYFFGVIFFFLPDYLGRKTTMSLILIPVTIGNLMLVYSDSLFIKSIGYSICGFFHIRLTLSYTICYELIPDGLKNASSTFINFYDISTMITCCAFLMYVDNNMQHVFELYLTISVCASIIFFLVVPETPRWLFN